MTLPSPFHPFQWRRERLLASLLQVIQANRGRLWVSQRAFRGSPDALPWSCGDEDVSRCVQEHPKETYSLSLFSPKKIGKVQRTTLLV